MRLLALPPRPLTRHALPSRSTCSVPDMMNRCHSMVLGLAVLMSGVAQGQQLRPYQPAFDVNDYTLAIDLPDTGATIHAHATLSVTRTAAADTLRLDLLDLD